MKIFHDVVELLWRDKDEHVRELLAEVAKLVALSRLDHSTQMIHIREIVLVTPPLQHVLTMGQAQSNHMPFPHGHKELVRKINLNVS